MPTLTPILNITLAGILKENDVVVLLFVYSAGFEAHILNQDLIRK